MTFALSHVAIPLSIYGFVLPIFLYQWYSIFIILIVGFLIKNLLDQYQSASRDSIGTWSGCGTIFTLAYLFHVLLMDLGPDHIGPVHHPFGGPVGWIPSCIGSYYAVSRVGNGRPNSQFAAFCSAVFGVALALQIYDGIEADKPVHLGDPRMFGWLPLQVVAGLTALFYLLFYVPCMPFYQTPAQRAAAIAAGRHGKED